MSKSHCTKCGTDTARTDTDPGTYTYVCPVCGQSQEFVISSRDASEISVCPVCGKTHIAVEFFDYIKFVTNFGAASGVWEASIAGPSAGSVTWELDDGIAGTITQTGLSASYAFTTDGPHDIRLKCDLDQITAVDVHSCGLTDIDGIGSCGALVSITAHTNSALVFDIDNLPSGLTFADFGKCSLLTGVIDNLPSGLTFASFYNCSLLTGVIDNLPSGLTVASFGECSLLTGVIDNLPSGLTVASFYNCSLLTGVIDNLPSGLTFADFGGCSLLTGSDVHHMAGIGEIYLHDQSADLARVNAIVDDVYANLLVFTDETITMSIDGNNAKPSAAQITKIEELQADYGWAITYTMS